MKDDNVYEGRYFGIESRHIESSHHGYDQYRWHSNFNGARGAWCHDRNAAVRGGWKHCNCMFMFLNAIVGFDAYDIDWGERKEP